MPKREEIVTGEEEAGGQLQEPPVLPTPQASPIQLPSEEAAPEIPPQASPSPSPTPAEPLFEE